MEICDHKYLIIYKPDLPVIHFMECYPGTSVGFNESYVSECFDNEDEAKARATELGYVFPEEEESYLQE